MVTGDGEETRAAARVSLHFCRRSHLGRGVDRIGD
jgi:hypothetical protein